MRVPGSLALLLFNSALIALSLAACGSSSSSSSEGTTGSGVTLDPGRSVKRCLDCAMTEYCIDINDFNAGTDEYYCAPDGCKGDCTCLMADAKKRHVECPSSCQTGSEMVYCAKH